MAKFRRHHSQSRSRNFTGRLVLVFLLLLGMLLAIFWFAGQDNFLNLPTGQDSIDYSSEQDRFFIPTTKNGTIVHHKHYTLSYNEAYEQAEWVAYYLTKASLQAQNVPRARRFEEDPLVSSKSAHYEDYKGSGYDRGHLVPAADMAFSKTAMEETFYMSNISPQVRQFNGGIWRELEENVRDWAYKFTGLYVVTGPIVSKSQKNIGRNKVRVPDAYFKAILDIDSSNPKGIAFLLENQVSFDHLDQFAISIDELEKVTGIEFFNDLMEDDVESSIESTFDISRWPISTKRFDLRNTKWNRVK